MKKVAILGGGVAGMSAAQELIERGFQVEVYEKQAKYVGGKARSVNVPNSGKGGRKDLPGEHGFRFFPGFYKHITDTMSRIPIPEESGKTVLDNLAISERAMMARFGKSPLVLPVNFPKNKKDIEVIIAAITHADTGLTKADEKKFAEKLWQLMTSCHERRQEDYERISWWQYTEADQQCDGKDPCPYQTYFVGGLTHTLVAAQPKLMSAKTGGDILIQLILLMLNPKSHADRVLNAPTNDAWLNPWYDYLISKGVKYHHNHKLKSFDCEVKTRMIQSATVENESTGELIQIEADYFISAVPVEVMASLINENMIKVDGTLAYIKTLKDSTNWMNGIQFYLNEDVKLTKGHVMFLDSPWAITAISQIQFWDGFDISQYGDGEVKGILSTDISDWFTPGLNGKRAVDCNKAEILEEVWAQMEQSLMQDGKPLINKEMILSSYIDNDIVIEKRLLNPNHDMVNEEPLLVNRVNTWSLRPEAHCNIKNLFLASDYVRTNTDLATMEGANEAARRAVNAILLIEKSDKKECEIWKLHEPWELNTFKKLDKKRFDKGEPWSSEVPWLYKLRHRLVTLFK